MFCVFLHGRREDMSKSVVFLGVFARSKRGNVEKCHVFMCFLGKVEKCRVFVCFCSVEGGKCRKVLCFCVFSG